jgi:soluble lytic murein transglycosylase-like protein
VSNLYDPAQNVRAGSMYLRDLLKKFNNDLHLSLAAYNAGEEAVIRSGNRIPPYRETQQYLPKVLEQYRQSRLATQ